MALYAFDGTWNYDSDDDCYDTNIVRFKELYMGNNADYIEGVGTRFGKIGKTLGGILGLGGKTRIDEMYDELCDNWNNGDKIIDIIGFSRGAALAVHFANLIGKKGIQLPNGNTKPTNIRFLGVWDIVASFGLSFDTIIDFQSINLGWNIDEVNACVEHCFHAMALDERRETFNITRLDPDNKQSKTLEMWFRGVHSDIGGGNTNESRSNIALQWMLEKAIECKLPINKIKQKLPRYSSTDTFAQVSENTDVKIDKKRDRNAKDSIHKSVSESILKKDESHVCRVFAKSKFTWSGVTLEEGAEYSFSVAENDTWQDGNIECGPKGWESKELPWYKEGIVEFFENFRRKKDANWFALIGTLGNDHENLFLVGDCSKTYTAAKECDLYLFANDMWSKYGNNDGYLDITITRS